MKKVARQVGTDFTVSVTAFPSRQSEAIANVTLGADETVVAGIGGDGAVERATPRTFWIGLRVSR